MQKDDLPAKYTPMAKYHNHSAPGEAEIHTSTMILSPQCSRGGLIHKSTMILSSPCLLHVINGLLHLLTEEQGGK